MRISKKCEYALRSVVEMALLHQEGVSLVRIPDLAKRVDVPPKFLEQILLSLKKEGILKSQRGARGGYSLALSTEKISLGHIIKCMDGDLFDLPFQSAAGAGNWADPRSCPLKPVMKQVQSAIQAILDGCTLARVVSDAQRRKQTLQYDI